MTPVDDRIGSAVDGNTTGRTVVALFRERSQAEAAIRDLKNAGFTNEQIGVAGLGTIGANAAVDRSGETASEMSEGAAAGAITGGVLGGLVGLLSSLLIPGLGPLVVGGVLASGLMGLGVGAATGGLIGALVGMGIPEEDARYFDAGLREGRTLLTVTDTDRAPEALAVLERHEVDLGPSRAGKVPAFGGAERRRGSDAGYAGPERRLVGAPG